MRISEPMRSFWRWYDRRGPVVFGVCAEQAQRRARPHGDNPNLHVAFLHDVESATCIFLQKFINGEDAGGTRSEPYASSIRSTGLARRAWLPVGQIAD